MPSRREFAEACAKAAVDIAPLGLSGAVLFVVWVLLWDQLGWATRIHFAVNTTTLITAVLVGVLYRLFVNRNAARILVVVIGCGFLVSVAGLLTLVEALR